MNCRICNLPLSEAEIALNHTWHSACEKCEVCHKPMPLGRDRITELLDAAHPLVHTQCAADKAFQEFKTKEFPATKERIAALNDGILKHYRAIDPDETDVSTLYDLLINLKELTATVSFALGLAKDRIEFKNNQNYNAELGERKRLESENRVAKEKVKIQKQDRTEQLKAERDNPQLKAKRKAIEGYAKTMNCSIEEAEAALTQLSNKGQNEKPN